VALLRLFGSRHRPVGELIEATGEVAILRTDIYDREPLGERWGEGRVTLLGEAAHPMTPNLGQGACQAVEDAVVLARCLREAGATAALRRYERLRSDRAAMIVRRARRVGRVGQVENPLLCRLRDRALAMGPPKAQLRQLEEVVGHEVQKGSSSSPLVNSYFCLATKANISKRAAARVERYCVGRVPLHVLRGGSVEAYGTRRPSTITTHRDTPGFS
jgi:flavin-dependent dehydrogenase